jgi:hypothetical protein
VGRDPTHSDPPRQQTSLSCVRQSLRTALITYCFFEDLKC